MAKRISKEIKEEIVRRIKDENLSVADACNQYGVGDSAIYRWLDGDLGQDINPILELNRLKRENQELKELIGFLTYENSKQKKLK